MNKSFTIHDLPRDKCPHERFLRFGKQVISSQELLQRIIGRGIVSESVAVTPQKLLTHFDSLQKLAGANISQVIPNH